MLTREIVCVNDFEVKHGTVCALKHELTCAHGGNCLVHTEPLRPLWSSVPRLNKTGQEYNSYPDELIS